MGVAAAQVLMSGRPLAAYRAALVEWRASAQGQVHVGRRDKQFPSAVRTGRAAAGFQSALWAGHGGEGCEGERRVVVVVVNTLRSYEG